MKKKLNIPLSKEQLSYIEDAIINKLQPVYSRLELARMGKALSNKDLDEMLKRMENVVNWIREHRPIKDRFQK